MRVSQALTGILPWILIAILIFNMTQRRYMDVGIRKRYATLWIAGLVAASYGASIAFKRFGVPDLWLCAVGATLAVVAFLARRLIFLFRLRCARCRAPLPIARILYHDDPHCPTCQAALEETTATP